MLNQTGSCVAGCHRTSAAEWLNFSCLELRRAIKEAIEIHARAMFRGHTASPRLCLLLPFFYRLRKLETAHCLLRDWNEG